MCRMMNELLSILLINKILIMSKIRRFRCKHHVLALRVRRTEKTSPFENEFSRYQRLIRSLEVRQEKKKKKKRGMMKSVFFS